MSDGVTTRDAYASKNYFLSDDDQEKADQIPDLDKALKEEMLKLKVRKMSRFVSYRIS